MKTFKGAWFAVMVSLVLCFGAGGLVANVIPGLFNTGVDDTRALLPAGAVDPHWRLIQSADFSFPGPNAYVVNEGYPVAPAADSPWLANGPDSKWIAPQAAQGTGNQPGDYVYRITFSLTGLEPDSAVITGRWSSDNAGADVRLNGVSTGVTYDGNFKAFSTTFTIEGGFLGGLNTLDFVVNNASTIVNPTALRVELSGTADPQAPPGTAPSILAQPVPATVGLGGSATFRVRVYGSKPLSYRWRRDGVPILHATNATFFMASVGLSDEADYDVVASNDFGSVTSAPAALTVVVLNPAQLTYEPLGPSTRRTGLVFSELMYHPADRADGRNVEFIELYNSNPFFEDLSRYRLSGEVDYTFPDGTTIDGLGFLVVAPAPADVEAAYGITGVLGGFTNRLSNGGGTLRLQKRSGAVVLEVSYDDDPPWPVAADGAGHSLVLARPSYGERNPKAWEASGQMGGSPGSQDPVPAGRLANVVINEILAHTDLPSLDFIELYNCSPQEVDLSGCWLSDDPGTNKHQIASGTLVPPNGFLVLDQEQLGFGLGADGDEVLLWDPARERVIDAWRYGGQANGVSCGRFPDGAPGIQALAERTPGQTNAPLLIPDIVINEIMYHPISGDADDEYVELYNQAGKAVDVGGWQFLDGIDYAFPAGTSIPAGGYLVLAANAARLLTNYPGLNPSSVVGDFGGNLADGGERLALARPDVVLETNGLTGTVRTNTFFVVVDEVTYQDGGRWGQWSDGGGSSLELKDARSDNRLPSNWADSDETAKAPWTLVEHTGVLDLGTGAAAAQLQLHLQGPGEALVDDVEVFLPGSANRISNPGFESGVTGWFFQGTQRRTSLETGQGYNSGQSLHVRASDRGDHVVNRVRAPFTSSFNVGQTATIRARVRWLRGHPEILFRLKENYLEAAGRLVVPPNLGTPGARNTAAVANAAPAITAVTHRPALPAANQPIRVTAWVHDPDGVATVRLRYRIDPSSTLLAVPMVDNGTGGDWVAGDGWFTGLIPGQVNGKLVAFHVEATDGAAAPASGRFPADAPERECLVRTGESVPAGAFGTYRLWMTQATHAFWSSREKMSNEALDTTFVYGTNRVIYNTGAFYAGSAYTSPGYDSPSGNLCGYDIIYPDDDSFLGDTHVTLDWPVRDETDQREQLMFWLLDQYGLPNLYRRYVHMFVNGVRRGTIYDDVQQPGRDVVEEWFPNDAEGAMFKTDYWHEFDDAGNKVNPYFFNTLENFTTTGGLKKTARYRWNWRPRIVRGSANDFGALFDLVDAANSTGDAYINAVESVVDMEHWMRTFAMHDLASYWDAFGNPNYKNTYLYKPERSGWKQFSWDFDVGLGAGINIANERVDAALFPAGIDPAVQRMYNTHAFVRAYWRALEEAVYSFFTAEAVTPILQAKYEAFQANGVGLTSPFVASGLGQSIPDFITQRRSFLLTQLATVVASFAVNGPDAITTSNNLLVLTGTAPVSVKTIAVNGIPYPIVWTGVTTWSVRIPLEPGLNGLVITGLDRLGNPVPGASRTISATFTGTAVSPVDIVVISEIMYNPLLPGSSFVEIYNLSPTLSFDLSGWRVNGLAFTFPQGSIITNGQYLVLAKDAVAFGQAFGNSIPVFAQFDGTLDNDGETLTLYLPGALPGEETAVDRVTYEDQPPWPSSADGLGPSLQLIDPRQDNSRVSNWSDGQDWRLFSYSGSVGSRSGTNLSFYFGAAGDTAGGDIFLDDLSFVQGSTPDAGPNLLANGGFEAGLTSWVVGALATNSVLVTNNAHSGDVSLHLVVGPGPASLTTFYQSITPVATSVVHTLSFYYKPGHQNNLLNARFNTVYKPTLNQARLLATPGASNATTANLPPYPPLWLSEVQPDNRSTLLDNAGQPDPWIEIYHSGPDPLGLTNFFLSDQIGNLTAWPVPNGTVLQPAEYRLVWADGQPEQSDPNHWHAGFRLNPTNGMVILSRLLNGTPQILDYLRYHAVSPDRSWGAFPPAQASFRQEFYFPTPGTANDPTLPPLPLFVNEWMASNSGTVLDPADQDADDWFEIYNPNDNTVDLAGYRLSDDPARPAKFVIPQGYQIPPRQFLLIWADEEGGQASLTGQLHVNFKLSAGGESISLRAPDGLLVDSVSFGPQAANLTQGRFPDGAPAPFPTLTAPTPGQPNILIIAPPDVVIQEVLYGPAGLSLTWSAEPGQVFRVQFKDDLGAPVWTDLPGDVVALGNTASQVDAQALSRPQRFYRILLLP